MALIVNSGGMIYHVVVMISLLAVIIIITSNISDISWMVTPCFSQYYLLSSSLVASVAGHRY